MPVGWFHKTGELELASILMLKNVNKLQNVDACLHFYSPLTHVGVHYKSNQLAFIIKMTIASQ